MKSVMKITFDDKEEAELYRQKIREIKYKLRMHEKNGKAYPEVKNVFKIAIDLLHTSMKAYRNQTKIVIDGELVYQARVSGETWES